MKLFTSRHGLTRQLFSPDALLLILCLFIGVLGAIRATQEPVRFPPPEPHEQTQHTDLLQTDLAWILVGFLYAVAIGEIAIEAAKLARQRRQLIKAAPVIA